MFTKILIANRGEIACRVAATARRLGIKTVAVYSDADAQAKHVQVCDEAVRLGPAPAKESYLRGEAIIAAAKATGAQAIHPGYGFLSENEDFAADCEKAGVVFIGPPASAISAMGLKAEAKARMAKANVPLVPGYHGADQTPALLEAEARRIGFPVLIKASAGGGGKGMRVVEEASGFQAALESCKREASNSFGDDAVLIEKYLTKPRHIEVQVFADTHGECVYLFERDCSVQRRHQKVLEEAPAPGLTVSRSRAMGEAAVAAAKAVGYVGAGTVEFIAEGDDFYFMEMNTRLQVEHPVTELITGFDLVEWQLRVARGERLPARQDALRISGHAIEARVYAENPEKGFLPSVGTLEHLALPEHVEFQLTRGVRVDSGVREGDTITPFYDPMIAKVIVWGEDRADAVRRLDQALCATHVLGPSTNVPFLSRLVRSEAFATAQLDTGLIARHQAVLFPPDLGPSPEETALVVAAMLEAERATQTSDPWSSRSGFRLNAELERTIRFTHGSVTLTYRRDGVVLLEGQPLRSALTGESPHGGVRWGDRQVVGSVIARASRWHVFHRGQHRVLECFDAAAVAQDDAGHGGRLVAPMPGKIVALVAPLREPVKKGAPLVVMEAMKMEHTVTAPADGLVEAFAFAAGDQVAEGAELLTFKPGA